jgi:hypothetical protein
LLRPRVSQSVPSNSEEIAFRVSGRIGSKRPQGRLQISFNHALMIDISSTGLNASNRFMLATKNGECEEFIGREEIHMVSSTDPHVPFKCSLPKICVVSHGSPLPLPNLLRTNFFRTMAHNTCFDLQQLLHIHRVIT